MASSRASSPANDSMPASPSELTPRSKVQAMLAALDDDSDGESNAIPKKPDFLSRTGSHAISEADLDREASNPLNNIDTADDAEDEEEEVVFKPRGRLAARMLAVNPNTEGDGYGDGVIDTARDRVRKLLAAEAIQSPKVNIEEGHSGSIDGEEKSIVSRKRKIRRAREATPNPEASDTSDASPGRMFVSPAVHKSPVSARDAPSSDDDLPANPTANARFLALVEKKRQERLAKEAEVQRQKAEKAAEQARLSKHHSTLLEDDGVEYSDDDGGRKLTQQARPTRKASKKALEEMHRETQRMSRNMQLAHEARTKKKITKSDLFARFNYKPAGFVEDKVFEQARPTSSSSAPRTDSETKDTPPTSPVSHINNAGKLADMPEDGGNSNTGDFNMSGIISEEDIPSLKDALTRSIHSSPPPLTTGLDKGKGRAFEEPEPLPTGLPVLQTTGSTLDSAPIHVRPPKVALKAALAGNDSDSDLEIVANQTPIRKTKESIFDRIPAKQARESHSLQALRMLANVTSPGKQPKGRNVKPSLTATELQMSLQQRARQQAMREREERLQSLRDKGVIVQTAEEREREMADIEDLMAKARREGEEIMKREKDAAKRERKAKGEVDPLGDSSDDEEWEEEKDNFAEQMSGSGSESDGDDERDASNEEEDDEEEDEDAMSLEEEEADLATSKPADMLIDNEASESDTAEEDADISGQDAAADFIDDGDEVSHGAQNEEEVLPNIQARRRTKQLVVSDDEDEQDLNVEFPILPHTESPLPRNGESPKAPPSVLRSATKTFIPGLTVAGPAGLGLTQIFAGTMDDSQIQVSEDFQSMQSQPAHELDTAQDSLAFLRNLPGPDLPAFEPTMDEESQDIVRDSQTQVSQVPESPLPGAVSQAIHLHFSQSQIQAFDSMPQNPSATQISEFPEPTQDAGFQAISPIKGRFIELPPSTIDTVILRQTPVPDRVKESPIAKKKGKLRRRDEVMAISDDEHGETSNGPAAEEIDEFEISENIFDVMRKASKRKETAVDDFDKKKSGAKEMVQEQAEESEDEYAGLGGASDDESGGEEDAYVKEMIDDEGGKDIDESKLAAFYA
jgi:mediator of replication checkpoint protein 1